MKKAETEDALCPRAVTLEYHRRVFLNLRNIPAVKDSDVVEKLDNGESFTAYEVFAGDTIDWYRIRTSFTGNEG